MQLNDLRGQIGSICQIAALCLAIAAGLKLFGFVAVRGSVIDLAAVAIALAHVR